MKKKRLVVGIKKLEDVNFDLKKYEQLNKKEKEETLWEYIGRIAEDETEVCSASFFPSRIIENIVNRCTMY